MVGQAACAVVVRRGIAAFARLPASERSSTSLELASITPTLLCVHQVDAGDAFDMLTNGRSPSSNEAGILTSDDVQTLRGPALIGERPLHPTSC